MIYIDTKFVSMMGSSLSGFKQKKPDLWNFRCPICGDSDVSSTKARGYFYTRKGAVFMKCHNCGASKTLGSFMKSQNPVLYKQYRVEKFQSTHGENGRLKNPEKSAEKSFFKRIQKQPDLLKTLCALHRCETSNIAKKFVLERKIPSKFHRLLFYCPDFHKWTSENKLDVNSHSRDPKLIIPFYEAGGKTLLALQARDLVGNKNSPKYLTVKIIEDAAKIYGLERIVWNRDHYVVEGPLDSLFLSNSIAMAGSDLDWDGFNEYSVFCFDNEPRSVIIHDKMKKIISENKRICIWPEHVDEKDVNDMFLSGKYENVEVMIAKNVWRGASAMAQFTKWKKR